MVTNLKSYIPKPNYGNNYLKRTDDLDENFSKLEIKLDKILSKQVEYNSKIENLEEKVKINILNFKKDLFVLIMLYLSIILLFLFLFL